MYDPMTIMASVPSLRERFFEPFVIEGANGLRHEVLGVSTDQDGVKRPVAQLQRFMLNAFFQAISPF